MVFGIDDMLIAGGISAAGSIAGSAIGGSSAADAQEAANKANAEQAEIQRRWMDRMAGSAHQRQVSDLRAAGLNPILSAGGSGAQVGAGSMPTMEPVNRSGWVGEAVGKAANTGVQVAQLKRDFESKDAQIAAQKAQALASVAQANNAQASAKATMAEMPSIRARAASAGSEAEARKATAEFDKKAATYDGVVNRVLQAVGGVVDAVNIKRILQGSKNDQRNQTMREERHMYRQGAKGTSLP